MSPLLVFGAAITAGALALALRAAHRARRAFAGTRLVTCPETRAPAAVEVDPELAALSAALGRTRLRLRACTSWPEHRGCGEPCVREIKQAPAERLLHTILARWYEGKACARCGFRFGELRSSDYEPALLDPDGRTREWQEIPAETIPEALKTHLPVCWYCHVIESFHRERPELVVSRGQPSS